MEVICRFFIKKKEKKRHKQLDVFSRFCAIIQMKHYFETIHGPLFSTALSIIYTCNKLKT